MRRLRMTKKVSDLPTLNKVDNPTMTVTRVDGSTFTIKKDSIEHWIIDPLFNKDTQTMATTEKGTVVYSSSYASEFFSLKQQEHNVEGRCNTCDYGWLKGQDDAHDCEVNMLKRIEVLEGVNNELLKFVKEVAGYHDPYNYGSGQEAKELLKKLGLDDE